MSCLELQEEEEEVLLSIYDGDPCFKQVDKTCYQYKIGEDGDYKSFLLEVKWHELYPEEVPNINLAAFYNNHILDSVKESTVKVLSAEIADFVGSAMTYTIFEHAKDNAVELMASQPDAPLQTSYHKDKSSDVDSDTAEQGVKVKVKKEHFTKAQKRKMYNRLDNKGEMPRGHDWVDIVRHLSQTGGQQS